MTAICLSRERMFMGQSMSGGIAPEASIAILISPIIASGGNPCVVVEELAIACSSDRLR
jgi:hypothetical protein